MGVSSSYQEVGDVPKGNGRGGVDHRSLPTEMAPKPEGPPQNVCSLDPRVGGVCVSYCTQTWQG